ncbi:helix-turn-helix transcriptional regulator [Cupriavidus taiwanensis]|uniref:helix-turn-helix transcriptional regulator n=1 Tax=Cupriavidus taiwanensis TaxID=164546 RepID=UPI0039C2A63F
MMRPIYVDLPTVASIVALSITSVQKLVREEQFPKPRAVSSRRVAWLVREVEEWAEARPISELPPPPNTSRRKPQ